MACVAATQVQNELEEKTFEERSKPIKVVSFYLMMGIRQDVIMTHDTFNELWERLEYV